VPGKGFVEARPDIVDKDGSVEIEHVHDFARGLWRHLLWLIAEGDGKKIWKRAWRVRATYEDFSGRRFESISEVVYDGADSSVTTVLIRMGLMPPL
jgi:hypothetical protein